MFWTVVDLFECALQCELGNAPDLADWTIQRMLHWNPNPPTHLEEEESSPESSTVYQAQYAYACGYYD